MGSGFGKLLVLKIFREEKLIFACGQVRLHSSPAFMGLRPHTLHPICLQLASNFKPTYCTNIHANHPRTQYVANRLGAEFTEPPPWSLDDVFPDTTARTPIIFILSTGADPTAMLQRFAEKKGWLPGERLHMISLGQGQGPIAEMLIAQASKTGDWLCLQVGRPDRSLRLVGLP